MTAPWLPAANWRHAAPVAAAEAVAARRWPDPPPPPMVRVRALSPSWLHSGRPVEPGELYAVDVATARQLIARGKAAPA